MAAISHKVHFNINLRNKIDRRCLIAFESKKKNETLNVLKQRLGTYIYLIKRIRNIKLFTISRILNMSVYKFCAHNFYAEPSDTPYSNIQTFRSQFPLTRTITWT